MVAQGWPFLIGRGHHTGHKVLLAPDFLVTSRGYGILEGISGNAVTKLGALTVRSATHQVEAPDVATTERPRDEHGRPLRLIYGVVAKGIEPVNSDLPNALEAALATFRRFWHDEEDFAVEPSAAFPLSTQPSTVVSPAPPEPSRPHGARVAVLCAALVAVLAAGLTVLLGHSARYPVPGSPRPACVSVPTPGAVACDGKTMTTGRKP